MVYLIIYLSIGFGVWLGLCALRLKLEGFVRQPLLSYVLGFLGGLMLWPILLFMLEGGGDV